MGHRSSPNEYEEQGSLFILRTVQRVFAPTTLTRPPCVSITYPACVSAGLVIKHAMRKRHIVICGLSACTIFSTLSHKRYDFPKKNLLNKKYVLIFYTGLFISPSGISELDCATTKTDTVERSISIARESLQVIFVLGALAYFQVPPLGGSRDEKWRSQ